MKQLRVGLLVNPIAGLGGPAAFKGSDHHWRDALAAGYAATALERARHFAAAVTGVSWVTVPGAMGGDHVADAAILDFPGTSLGETSPADTRAAATALAGAGVDLLCFVGGDGTAADVAAAVGDSVPCLGVPGGVKITSPVFAHDVDEAAWMVSNLGDDFETALRDVTDLDEAAYRAGRLEVNLRGCLLVPLSPAVQGGKQPTGAETPLEPLVEQVLDDWPIDDDALSLVGAGAVCLAVKRQFWGEATLLGVDAIVGTRIVANNLDARKATALVQQHQDAGKPVRIVVSPIGGQGMLLGRGTQVLAPDALALVGWSNLTVVAPPEKLLGLRGLRVDLEGPRLLADAPKYIRVTTGWHEHRMLPLLFGAPA